jgi:hypothetical protein
VQTIAFITLPSAYLKMVMPTFEVLFMTSLERVPVSYFSILWNSERVFFELLWRKLEDIIRIKSIDVNIKGSKKIQNTAL